MIEIIPIVRDFVASAQAQKDQKFKVFVSDNDFDNTAMRAPCREILANQKFSPPRTHQRNGRAERFMRTLKDLAHTMTEEAILPLSFWLFAIQHAAQLRNLLGHASFNNMSQHQK